MSSLSAFGCHRCGCTPTAACRDDHGNQCTWITPRLCSHCQEEPNQGGFIPDTNGVSAMATTMDSPALTIEAVAQLWNLDPGWIARCLAPTTPSTEPNEPTGPPSSTPTTSPSADAARNPLRPVNPSTSAIAKTSHSAATKGRATPNTPTATAAPAKPSASTPRHPATGDPQLDAELEWTLR